MNEEVDSPKVEAPYFAYGASLRIFGDVPEFDRLPEVLGVPPTHVHRKGELRASGTELWTQDMWSYSSPLPKTEKLAAHLEHLSTVFQPHIAFLKNLKKTCSVDIFCKYTSDCDHAGFEVDHKALFIFEALEIPFGVSIVIV
jgi:hypothetical protein